MTFNTLTQAFQAKNDSLQTITYIEGKDKEVQISYADLNNRALRLLAYLQNKGLKQGDELIIFLKNNERFIEVFWACILGGIIPVPVAIGISDEHRSKLFKIFSQLVNGRIYIDNENLQRLNDYAQSHDLVECYENLASQAICHDLIKLDELIEKGEVVEVSANDTAFIQFSSGSTSDPKGVVLSHGNIAANVKSIAAGSAYNDTDCSLSWMPLTHDMGLIGFHINMLVWDIRQCIMATDLFSRRPLLWLEKASEHKASLLCSPNFGYKHYLKSFANKEVELDLSSVRLIYNGAEPISVDTCEQFLSEMAQYGLKNNTMFTVYGLAEATLAVAFPEVSQPYRVLQIARHDLLIGEEIELVVEGPAVENVEIKISNSDNQILPEKHIGEIQIKGPNVTQAYYRNAEANEQVFTGGGWLNTGDLGFLHNNELVVTGRSKDIIFANGQNYFPHDLEDILIQNSSLELGKVVVSSATRADQQTDELLVFVFYRDDTNLFPALASELAKLITFQTGLSVDAVMPVKRIPKTTSGKVQRRHLVNAYLTGEYDAVVYQPKASGFAEELPEEGGLTALEKQLLDICNSILKEQTIAANENFFDAGISSLALSEIHAKIDDEYPDLLDIVDFFDYQTVVEVAGLIVKKQGEGL